LRGQKKTGNTYASFTLINRYINYIELLHPVVRVSVPFLAQKRDADGFQFSIEEIVPESA